MAGDGAEEAGKEPDTPGSAAPKRTTDRGPNAVGVHLLGLKHPRTPKTKVTPTQGIRPRSPDNHVIQKLDVDRPRRLPQLACNLQIGRTRGRVARYTAYGISGVMPHPVLCRMPGARSSEILRLDAA